MLQGSHNEPRKCKSRKSKASASIGGEDGRASARGRASGRERCLSKGEHSPGAAITLASEVSAGRDLEFERDQARPETERESRGERDEVRKRSSRANASRDYDRTSGDEKKESLGLDGPLYGRHLTKVQREDLVAFIDSLRITKI